MFRKLAIRIDRQYRVPTLTSAYRVCHNLLYQPFVLLVSFQDSHAIPNESPAKLKPSHIHYSTSTMCVFTFHRQRSSVSFHTFFYDFSFRLFFFSLLFSCVAFIWIVRQRNYIEHVCCNAVLWKKEKKNENIKNFLWAHKSASNASIQPQFGTVAQIQNQITWRGERL